MCVITLHMQCFRFNYLQLLSSHHSVFSETNINRYSFLCSNPADIATNLGTSINQVGVSGKSIIYVRSSGEFRSFNSSVTFVSGLGRTPLYKRILEKSLFSLLFFFLFLSFCHLAILAMKKFHNRSYLSCLWRQ